MTALVTAKNQSAFREIIRNERLPAVILDLDAFDSNLRLMRQIVERHPRLTLRIATKSLRVPELIARVLKQGHPFRGVMCFSAEEARVLSSLGVDDFLIAYPTVQPADLLAIKEIHESGKSVRLVVDDIRQFNLIQQRIGALTRPLPLIIDVDASLRWFHGGIHLGVRRSPIRSGAQVMDLLHAVKQYPQMKVIGAMLYEAQVAGLGDRNPFKKLINPIAGCIRRISLRKLTRVREEIVQAFRETGTPLEIFNGGGSGSLNWSSEDPHLTEVTAGSGLLCSHLFDYFSNIRFEPACFFALQASRQPDPSYVTCLGGGYIASGEPGWDRVPLPVEPRGAQLISMEGCGEVQTPVKLPSTAKVELGEPIFFRHAKAGELAERFNEYLLVSEKRLVGRAKTYRGLGHCFF